MPVELKLSDFTQDAIASLEKGTEHLVAQVAYRIVDVYKQSLSVGYGVDTGAMRESACAVTSEGSDYGPNVAAASEMNPTAEFAAEQTLSSPMEAVVQVPIGYSAYFEMGGAHSPAHPALTPAVEIVFSQIDNIAREVFDL